jgi:hypothetical protein
VQIVGKRPYCPRIDCAQCSLLLGQTRPSLLFPDIAHTLDERKKIHDFTDHQRQSLGTIADEA